MPKTAGELREDFVMEDLVLVLMANAGVVNVTKRHAPTAWERRKDTTPRVGSR